jgi:ParB/RepB/Spo0J family partition protein
VKTETRSLALRSICPDPNNPRFDLGDLTHLTEDIRDNGLIEPLVVRPGSFGKRHGRCRDCDQPVPRTPAGVLEEHTTEGVPCPGGSEPAGDEWYILAGHRRHAASIAAGLWEVPCVTRFDIKTDADALLLMLRENLHRRDLTPLEEAKAYEQLTLDFGMTTTRVAQLTHRSRKTVDRRLALTRLDEKAQRKLKTGQITLADAEALLNLPPERVEKVEASLGTREFRQEVTRARLGEDVTVQDVAAELRREFIAPFLSGGARPSADARDAVLRAAIGALTDALPRRVVRSWCEAVGVGDPIGLTTIPPMRALIGVAWVASRSREGTYDLLGALGYELSPVEVDLLEKESA